MGSLSPFVHAEQICVHNRSRIRAAGPVIRVFNMALVPLLPVPCYIYDSPRPDSPPCQQAGSHLSACQIKSKSDCVLVPGNKQQGKDWGFTKSFNFGERALLDFSCLFISFKNTHKTQQAPQKTKQNRTNPPASCLFSSSFQKAKMTSILCKSGGVPCGICFL